MTSHRSAPVFHVRYPSAGQVHAFESILVLVIAAEYWDRLIKNWERPDLFLVASVAAISALGIAVLVGRARRPAFAAIAAIVAVYLSIVFPAAGNHEYLELWLCLLCAWIDTAHDGERKLLTDAVRWITCIVLFWSGVQKLVHGYYFDGEYLAYSLSRHTYASVFAWLLPPDEMANLASYDGSPGTGPYVVRDPLFLVVSNLTCALEVVLAPLLLLRRTRPLAVVAVFLLLVAIESAAREMFFLLLFGNMLLLFSATDLHRRLIVPAAIVLGCMLLVRIGVLPEVTFN